MPCCAWCWPRSSCSVISQAEGVFDTTGVFAGMAVLASVVLVVGILVDRLEGYLLRWKVRDESPAKGDVA